MECGRATGPVVVLINPIGISFLLLAPLARRLGRWFRVLTWESRGLPNWDVGCQVRETSVAGQMDDMRAVVAAMGVTTVHLVAYCSGSPLAVMAVDAGIVKATSLCLVSPSLSIEGPWRKTNYQAAVMPLWSRVVGRGKTGAALVRSLLMQADRRFTNRWEAELDAINGLPFRSDETTLFFARLLAPWSEGNVSASLARIRIPTLLLHCEDDAVIHADTARAIHQALTFAALIVTPQGGHFAICRLASMQQAIVTFLASAGTHDVSGLDTPATQVDQPEGDGGR